MATPIRLYNPKLRDFLTNTAQGKSYTVVFVTILLVLVIFVFAIFPALSAVLFQIEENGRRREALTAISLKQETLKALVSEEQSKQAVSAALDSAFPNNLFQDLIVSDINKIADDTNVVLSQLSFGNIERQTQPEIFDQFAFLKSQNLRGSVQGNRTQVQDFLQRVEQAIRIYDVYEVLIVANTEAVGEFKLDFQAEVYYWQLPE